MRDTLALYLVRLDTAHRVSRKQTTDERKLASSATISQNERKSDLLANDYNGKATVFPQSFA
jgi:hypothetical protein